MTDYFDTPEEKRSSLADQLQARIDAGLVVANQAQYLRAIGARHGLDLAVGANHDVGATSLHAATELAEDRRHLVDVEVDAPVAVAVELREVDLGLDDPEVIHVAQPQPSTAVRRTDGRHDLVANVRHAAHSLRRAFTRALAGIPSPGHEPGEGDILSRTPDGSSE